MAPRQRVAVDATTDNGGNITISPVARTLRTFIQAGLGIAAAWVTSRLARYNITINEQGLVAVGYTLAVTVGQNLLEHFGWIRVLWGKLSTVTVPTAAPLRVPEA